MRIAARTSHGQATRTRSPDLGVGEAKGGDPRAQEAPADLEGEHEAGDDGPTLGGRELEGEELLARGEQQDEGEEADHGQDQAGPPGGEGLGEADEHDESGAGEHEGGHGPGLVHAEVEGPPGQGVAGEGHDRGEGAGRRRQIEGAEPLLGLPFVERTWIARGQRDIAERLPVAVLLAQERRRLSNFRDSAAREKERLTRFGHITFDLEAPAGPLPLKRKLDQFPFVPDDPTKRDRDCFEAYNIQVQGLAKRIEATNSKHVVIGISGGLDSTHALIVTARAFDMLGLPRTNIIGVTMPGFATTDATKSNAWALMKALGIDAREVSIQPLAQRMLEDLDHPAARGEPVYDVAYENVQAGLRTDYLFRLANKEGGFVVGTGDLSELALGWCTYGVGDHMSHYNVNGGAPKTLIQHLIRWVADTNVFDAHTSKTLRSVLRGEISPELIPGETQQSTQAVVGPYELQDFNLYWLTRYGLKPSKILFLAWSAWCEKYDYVTLRKWLELFLTRFFTNQYKRSAVPNGPKIVSGGALSPRGDWRMPSDASAATWLQELRANTPEKLD